MRKRLMMTLFGVLSGFAMAFADDVNYSGTVVTADGEPLMGATVTVTGTSVSTITDMDGKFSLIVPDGYSTVTVTYSGMKKQIVNVTREPIMLYANAEKAELARQARLSALKKPSGNRTYKRNAFNLEFSFGRTGGDFKDYRDSNYASINLGWKHNFSQNIGWHVLDLGAGVFDIHDNPNIDDCIFSATTGIYLTTPSFKGFSLFAELNIGAAYKNTDEHVDLLIRPRIGINLGKWVYLAYKYENIKLDQEKYGDWYDGYYYSYEGPDAIETHNICLGFNF